MPRVNNKRKRSMKTKSTDEDMFTDPPIVSNILGEDPPRGPHHVRFLEVVPKSEQLRRKAFFELPENAELKADTIKLIYPNGFN